VYNKSLKGRKINRMVNVISAEAQDTERFKERSEDCVFRNFSLRPPKARTNSKPRPGSKHAVPD